MFQFLADGGSGMATAAMIVGGMTTAQSKQRHADRQLGGVATAATTHATRYGDRVRVSIHIYIYIYISRCVSVLHKRALAEDCSNGARGNHPIVPD